MDKRTSMFWILCMCILILFSGLVTALSIDNALLIPSLSNVTHFITEPTTVDNKIVVNETCGFFDNGLPPDVFFCETSPDKVILEFPAVVVVPVARVQHFSGYIDEPELRFMKVIRVTTSFNQTAGTVFASLGNLSSFLEVNAGVNLTESPMLNHSLRVIEINSLGECIDQNLASPSWCDPLPWRAFG